MKVLVFAIALFMAASVALPAGGAPAPALTIPKGTHVPLRFTQAIDTETLQQGAKLTFAVATSVLVDRKPVIKEGTPGEGIVMKIEGPAFFRRARITIGFVRTAAADGGVVQLKDMVIGGETQIAGTHIKQPEGAVAVSETITDIQVAIP